MIHFISSIAFFCNFGVLAKAEKEKYDILPKNPFALVCTFYVTRNSRKYPFRFFFGVCYFIIGNYESFLGNFDAKQFLYMRFETESDFFQYLSGF